MGPRALFASMLVGLILCLGCGGAAVSPPGAGNATTPPATTPPTTPPAAPPPSAPQEIKAINHIVFMLQENRSFDSYFGQLGAYRAANGYGAATDVDGLPPGATNPADDGSQVASFHLQTSCIENISPDWLDSHGDYHLYPDAPDSNVFLGNGFVHSASGMARFSGMVIGNAPPSSSTVVTPKDNTNYYLFASTSTLHEPGWGKPLASILVTVNGSKNPAAAANIPTAKADKNFRICGLLP